MTVDEAVRAFRERQSVRCKLTVSLPGDFIVDFENIKGYKQSFDDNGKERHSFILVDRRSRSQYEVPADSLFVGEEAPKVKAKKPEPVKHTYGRYKNVKLTDEQAFALKDKFPKEWDKWIEKLSFYMYNKKATYRDHYATILNWARREEEKMARSAAPTKSKFNNYTDTNKPDYTNFSEQIIKNMLEE